MTEKIKQYWDERANSSNIKKLTTDDIWLRELEIKTMINTIDKMNLKEDSQILDVGCGDGYSTMMLAKEFPNFSFNGIDFSGNMIKQANLTLEKMNLKNIKFEVGNILELSSIFQNSFDLVMTDRCLINLDKTNLQQSAFSEIAKVIKNNGHYIGIENFIEGHNEMNEIRLKIGLDEIPIRWHNLFFKEKEFKEMISKNFNLLKIINFSSSYYYATRIIYSKMCQMQKIKPDYNHEIHQLSTQLPIFGNFSPIKLLILQKK